VKRGTALISWRTTRNSARSSSVEAGGWQRRAIALTARGDAVVALIRFRRQLATLDAEDRAYIADCLTTILKEIRP
jgi:hypothetical protein